MNTIVIGAGAAGMAAASTLAHMGIDTLLLEAQQNMGGRAKDIQWQESEVQVGGEELHGITSEYHHLMKKNDVQFYNLEEEKESMYQIDGQLIGEEQMEQQYPFYDNLFEELKREYKEMNEKQNGMSVQQWVQAQIKAGKLDASMLSMLEYEMGSEFGTCTPNISFRGMCKCFYEWKHGEINYQLKNTTHYKQLMKIFGQQQKSLTIKMGCVVVRVESNKDGVVVYDQNNKEYHAQRVVMAVPVSILKKGLIQFEPAFSQNRIEALNGIGMDQGGKLFIKLKSRVWHPQMGSINLQNSKICQEWWEHNGWAHDHDPSQPLIIASLISHPSHYSYVTNSQWQNTALLEIAQALSIEIDTLKQQYIEGYFEDWAGNEYIQGMYSYPNLEFKDDSRERASRTENNIYFCGEWTHPSDFATIHGAVEEGIRVAHEINKTIYHAATQPIEVERFLGL